MNKLYKVLVFATVVGVYVTLLATFFMAYINPLKNVLVTINTMGEAHVEFVVLLMTLPGTYLLFKDILFEWVLS